jgi:polyhydroxyalkanoate synthesis regulator phasin
MARLPTLWDASRMADLDALVRLLTRGADAARGEARRILDELVARGDLSRAEADEALARVQEAVEVNRRWLDERVVSPLRDVLRGAGDALRRVLDDESRPGGRDGVQHNEPEGQALRAKLNESEGQALRAKLNESEGQALRAKLNEPEGQALRAKLNEPEGQALRAKLNEPEGQALRALLPRVAALEARLARIEARLAERGAPGDG